MVLPNGHGLRLPAAFPALPLPFNLMGHCVALPTARCIPKNGVPNAMARCESCMPRAAAIVAPVLCVRSVKKAPPRLSRDG